MTRRGLAAVLAICLLPLTACAPQQKMYTATWFDVFDTVTTVQGYAASEQEWNEQADALHADLLYLHEQLDIYNAYDGATNLYTVNRCAADAPVQVEPELFDFLQWACKDVYTATHGAVNPAAGAVLRLWHDARESDSPAPPAQAAIDEALQHCDADTLLLDAENHTVYFADAAMQLDVGAVAKGYAAVQVGQKAAQRGLDSALLNVGGNVYIIGDKPDGSAWRVGVENPWGDSPQYLQTVELHKGDSLIVSGDYQRYFTYNGVRYAHLIDLTTGWPATYYSSTAVYTHPDTGWGDAWSTALFCLPAEPSEALAEQHADTMGALWMYADGSLRQSSGWTGKNAR